MNMIKFTPKTDTEKTETPARKMSIALAEICLDDSTQSRVALNDETTSEYAEAIAAGAKFPAVTVFFDGAVYWLADGFHRHAAHVKAGKKKILAEVHQGTQRDAILHSVGANASHGLRRTNDDKRRAVLTLLNDAEWGTWSDREIARRCAVSPQTVTNTRADTAQNGRSERQYVHPKTGSVTTMRTAGINAGRKTSADIVPNENDVRPATAAEVDIDYDGEIKSPPQAHAVHGIEGDDKAETATSESYPSDAPVESEADDPFGDGESQGRPFPDPLDDGQPAAGDPFSDPTEEVAAEQPAAGESNGNQYTRILVHTKVRGFDKFCKENPPEFVAEGVRQDEVASMRYTIGRINKWLEAFLDAAKKSGAAS